MNPLNKQLTLSETNETIGTGWLSPTPDLRDYTNHHKNIEPFNLELGIRNSNQNPPTAVDLRKNQEIQGSKFLIQNSMQPLNLES